MKVLMCLFKHIFFYFVIDYECLSSILQYICSGEKAVRDIFQYLSFFNLPLRGFLTCDYFSKVKVNSVPNKPPADVDQTRKSHRYQQFTQLRLLFWKSKACSMTWYWFQELKFVISQHARQATPTWPEVLWSDREVIDCCHPHNTKWSVFRNYGAVI